MSTDKRHVLIERRKSRGFSQERLAAAVGCAKFTIQRWEAGAPVGAQYREALARELGWSLEELHDALAGEVPSLDEGSFFDVYVALEQSATWIGVLQTVLLPGLLQTRDYAAQLTGESERLESRMARQRRITSDRKPASLVAVIDESVLYRVIGGVDVFVEQLRHLATIATRPNVVIRLLPFDAPAATLAVATQGSLTLLRFKFRGGAGYKEHRGGASLLSSVHDFQSNYNAFDRLVEEALSVEDTIARLHARVGDLSDDA